MTDSTASDYEDDTSSSASTIYDGGFDDLDLSFVPDEALDASSYESAPQSPTSPSGVYPGLLNRSGDHTEQRHSSQSTSVNTSSPLSLEGCVRVGHSTEHMRYLRRLPAGAQWTLIELQGSGKTQWHDLPLHDLTPLESLSSADAAAAVRSILNAPDSKSAEADVWDELDKEYEALEEGQDAGLGCHPDEPGFYGGQIEFGLSLDDRNKSRSGSSTELDLYYTVNPPIKGTSNRLKRFLGSDAVLKVSINLPEYIFHDDKKIRSLTEFLTRPVVLLGRVFRAFWGESKHAYLVMTNEVVPGIDNPRPGPRLSFEELITWHAPLELNCDQPLCKFASRFKLCLSNSVPGLILSPEDIHFSEDIYGEENDSTESCMTDGCGKINAHGLLQITDTVGWTSMPSAVQFRCHGAKGLLLLDKENHDEVPVITLRQSQVKVNLPRRGLHVAHRIIDVIRPARLSHPSRLSVEAIICMAENGCSISTLKSLLRKSLKEATDTFIDNTGPFARHRLWCTLDSIGGVSRMRLARAAGGSARAQGLTERRTTIDDTTERSDIDRMSPSGCPASLLEWCMGLLESGFEPDHCLVVMEKLRYALTVAINSHVQDWTISVPLSATAMIVPDPLERLKEGEIFISSSSPLLGVDGRNKFVIVGDVLVYRNPCKLPTDVQKVKAVDYPELRDWPDVIIFSVHGKRSLASLLSGGDYDGDTVTAIWDPDLVETFQNAPIDLAERPVELEGAFTRNRKKTSEFMNESEGSSLDRVLGLQQALLAGLRDGYLGKYSRWHEKSVYQWGYTAQKTLELAHKFNMIMDGAKTGHLIKGSILQKDRELWENKELPWREKRTPSSSTSPVRRNTSRLQRRINGAFVMDELVCEGEEAREECLVAFQKKVDDVAPLFVNVECPEDDLTLPWLNEEQNEKSDRFRQSQPLREHDLTLIRDHVEKMYEQHRRLVRQFPAARSNGDLNEHKELKERKHELAAEFAAEPPRLRFQLFSDDKIAVLKASYAFILDWRKSRGRGSTFPFDMAYLTLQRLKACGHPSGCQFVTTDFHRFLGMKSSVRQRFG